MRNFWQRIKQWWKNGELPPYQPYQQSDREKQTPKAPPTGGGGASI